MKKSSSIPMAMALKKYYCHECGEMLVKTPRTRVIRRGDPDYRKHNRVGNKHISGDVELTEYDLKCPSCDRIVDFDEQCVIDEIQKRLGKRELSQTEIDDNKNQANDTVDRKNKIANTVFTVFVIAVLIVIFYLFSKFGMSSIKFYF
ncbi:MAG: hypothetical protein IJ011_01550 [Clostridia bacterium]|nr:hypothetical protein [Clostridia bacterium]